MDCGNSVANSLHAQQFNRFPNLVWPTDLARMDQSMHAITRSAKIDASEFRRSYAQFVATDAKGDNARRGASVRPLDYLHCRFRSELPHRIKDPVGMQPAALKWLYRGQDRFEIGLGVLPAEEHHAYGKRYLGVNYILAEQLFCRICRE
jgi:hypothetical protein